MSDAIRPDQGSQAADPDQCPMHGGYNIPGEAECAGCTWVALVAMHQGDDAGRRAIGVAHSYAGRRYREGSAEYFYAAIDSLTDGMAKAEVGSQAADPGIVAEAVAALRCFGGDLTLADAMKLLPMWHYFPKLTPAEVNAILRHFADGAR